MNKSGDHFIKRYEVAAIAVCSLAWLLIAFNIPYMHDDWDWGLKDGIFHLVHADLNSRYMGNLFEVLMTRSVILKTLILGAGYSLIPFLSVYLHKVKDAGRGAAYLIVSILIFSLNHEMWSETYGWIAGAANFILVMPFLILWLYAVRGLYGQKCYVKIWQKILLFLLSFAMQLFLENIAITVSFISFLVLIHLLRRKSDNIIPAVVIFIGNLTGALICIFSGTVRELFGTGQAVEGYRRFVFGMSDPLIVKLSKSLGFFFSDCLPDVYHIWNAPAVISVIAVLTVYVLRSAKKRKALYAFALINVLICIYLSLSLTISTRRFYAVMGIVIFAVIIIEILLTDLKDKFFVLGIWIMAPLVISPMCILDNWGPRLFVTVFLLHIAMLSVLINNLEVKLSASMAKIIYIGIACVVIMRIALAVLIYAEIGSCTSRRMDQIQRARDGEVTQLYLEAYPHEIYLYKPDPKEPERVLYFKAFYGIPDNVNIITD